jgi:hypothetical protein
VPLGLFCTFVRLYCRLSGCDGKTLVSHIAVQGFPRHYLLDEVERQEKVLPPLGGGSGVVPRSGRRLRARSAVLVRASCSFKTPMICRSVNRARFIWPSLF